ncbi:hypothetical protein M9434_003923 [Picochlorum sp. BPE23]|nr:hypothetical protein M9434_003923 [Picochlorum sp. BPE23]
MEGGAGCERGHVNQLGLWEYDAPRFHDFEQPSPSYGACSVDEWFDTSATKGLMSPVSGGGSPDGGDSGGQKGVEKESDVTSKERKVLGNVTNTIKVVDPVVGMGPQKHHTRSVVETRNVCTAGAKADVCQEKAVHATRPVKRDEKPVALVEVKEDVEETSVQKKQEMPALHREDAASKKKKQDAAMHRPVTRSWTGKLTVPKSPMLLSRMRGTVHKKVIKSSEELEMEEIERKRKEVAALKKKNQCHRNTGLEQPRQPQNKRKQVTVPREPNLRTSKRMRTVAAVAPSGFTVGKPSTSNRQLRARNARPVARDESRPVTRSQNRKLTLPKTPNFATKGRTRAPRFKTTEELELEEIERNKFKAKPLNRKILEKKQSSKPAIKSKKPVTVPQPFSFATEKRAASGHSRGSAEISYPKPFIFGEGPVTRSKAKVATTKSTQKAGVGPKSQQEKKSSTEPVVTASIDEGLAQPRIRQAARGSLLLGGAMRVIRSQNDDDEPEAEPAAQQECTAADGVHDFIKNRGDDEKSTVHNPLFRM